MSLHDALTSRPNDRNEEIGQLRLNGRVQVKFGLLE
jgi:hypothetical protein